MEIEPVTIVFSAEEFVKIMGEAAAAKCGLAGHLNVDVRSTIADGAFVEARVTLSAPTADKEDVKP
jgi:hypothetical protein